MQPCKWLKVAEDWLQFQQTSLSKIASMHWKTIFTRSLIILNDSWHLFLHYLLEENIISYWYVSDTDTNKLADRSLLTDKTGLCEVTLRAISKQSLINATWRALSTLEVFNFRLWGAWTLTGRLKPLPRYCRPAFTVPLLYTWSQTNKKHRMTTSQKGWMSDHYGYTAH